MRAKKYLRKSNKLRLGALLVAINFLVIPSSVYAFASVEFAIREICGHMQGSLGGLLMATAGVGGLISAAFGNMKAMYSCVITAIGAFTISSMLSLHFSDAAALCNGGGGGGGGGTARTKLSRSLNEDPYGATAEVSRFNVEQAVKTYIEKSNTAIGTNPGTDTSLEKYADPYQEESDMELF